MFFLDEILHTHTHTHTHIHTHTLLICTADQQGRNAHDEVDVTEMQKCGAYEVIKLSQGRVTMKGNPAYSEVGIYTY